MVIRKESVSSLFTGDPLEKVVDKAGDMLYVQIVNRIRKLMQEGHLKEGDMLPSERELAQMFDVSRVPVREALKILEFLGAVQQVRGKGVFVKKINMGHVLQSVDFLMDNPLHMLLDLFEAREAIEMQAVRLAAERRTDADMDVMEAILAEMERHIAQDRDIAEGSLNFHSAVIAAAHNEVLIRIDEFLSDMLKYSRKKTLSDCSRYKISLSYHRKIMEKIKEQDAHGAAEIMQEHLEVAKAVIAKMDK